MRGVLHAPNTKMCQTVRQVDSLNQKELVIDAENAKCCRSLEPYPHIHIIFLLVIQHRSPVKISTVVLATDLVSMSLP